MKNQDNIGVVFVNTIVGRGSLNNVVNLTFGTFNWTPTTNESGLPVVDPDPVVSARLRMDLVCAKQLRDVMNDLIDSIEKAEIEAVTGVVEQVTKKPKAEKSH